MKKILLLLWLPYVGIHAALAADWSPGENLLTPDPPSAAEWDISTSRDGAFRSMLWQRKGEGIKDSYIVSIHGRFEEKLPEFQSEQDAPGQKGCDTFKSESLDDSPVNGYSRLLWRTLCVNKNGFTASILQVAIQGRDSFYHVQKIWRRDVPEEELDLWRKRLSSISVCDTRDSENPCPDGYHRVK